MTAASIASEQAGQPKDALAPWLRPALRQILAQHQGHALLLHGSPGDGCWDLAWALGQAWLCEAGDAIGLRPCGHCGACGLFQQSSHPDQQWLMPQDLALDRGLPVDIKEGRKPSRQIRIDDVRATIETMNSTSGRGRGRALVVFPGEAMNDIAASALLKTLEEPPAGTRMVIATAEPARLLATIRSRCQHWTLPTPDRIQAQAWLETQGVPGAGALLDAASNRPLAALAMHRAGITAQSWASLPQRLVRGDGAAGLIGLSVPAALDALSKVCHDAMAVSVGGKARFFPGDSLPRGLDLQRLSGWQRTLAQLLRQADHPWNEALMLDALALEAQRVLRSE